MSRTRVISACVAILVLLASAGGCVSQSTHDKVLARLAATEASLTTSRTQHTQLKQGVGNLALECDSAILRVRSTESAVTRLKQNDKRVAECLAELRDIVASQTRSIQALETMVGPLRDELAKLRKRASALAGPSGPAPQPRVLAADTTP